MKSIFYTINSLQIILIFYINIIRISADIHSYNKNINPQSLFDSITNKKNDFKKNITLKKEIKQNEYNYDKHSNKKRFLDDPIRTTYNTIKGEISSYTTGTIKREEDKYLFQLTTSLNEKNLIEDTTANTQLSMIDLNDCLTTLATRFSITDPIIILKYESKSDLYYHKNIQFEIYNPDSFRIRLDLSVCKNNNIKLYFKFDLDDLDEETLKLYYDLKKNGYDLLNQNDPFYQDICTTYTSKDNTDVLLTDRRNYYFIKEIAPQSNCKYSGYSSQKKVISFKYEVNDKEIDIDHISKYSGENALSKFKEKLKYLNLKTLKCYKLIFSSKAINAGTIISIILIVANLCLAIVYCAKEISPLKLHVAKFIFDFPKNIHKHTHNENNNNENHNDNHTHVNYPPRKKKHKARTQVIKGQRPEFQSQIEEEEKEEEKNSDIKQETNLEKKGKIKFMDKEEDEKEKDSEDLEKIEEEKGEKEENIGGLNNYIRHRHKKKKKSLKKKSSKTTNNYTRLGKKSKTAHVSHHHSHKNVMIETTKNDFLERKKTSGDTALEQNNEGKFDDYELNNMEYNKALSNDKRSFCQIYLSILKREHIIKFTILWDDYNLPYIKLVRFIFLLLTCISMNVFFFFDDLLHDLFIKKGKFNFVKLFPQIIFSTILIHVSDVIVCFFTMTDKYIYQIKRMESNEMKKKRVYDILKCIKIKLNLFFIYIFVLQVFYWYLITSFCVVYKNSQTILLLNSLFSLILYLIYPFLLYLLTTIFKYSGIKSSSSCLYCLGNVFPIF